jgi:hypothetical protein
MSDISQAKDTYAAGRWAVQIFGVLLGIATVVSLVKSGFAVELSGLPAKVYQQYAWLRDAAFEPIVLVLHYWGVTIPWWVRDLLMAYALIAAAHWRAFRRNLLTMNLAALVGFYAATAGQQKLRRSLVKLDDFRRTAWVTLWSLLWSLFLITLSAATQRTEDFWDQPIKAGENWREAINRSLAEIFTEVLPEFVRGFRRRIALNLFAIAVGTAGFFLWNYVQGVYGPSA